MSSERDDHTHSQGRNSPESKNGAELYNGEGQKDASSEGNIRRIKIVIVGDGAVGKTSLTMSYCQNKFPEEYVPTVFDNYDMELKVDDHPIGLTIWDTAGQDEYDRLRTLSYPGTDIFLMCFSLVEPRSFERIRDKWKPELAHHCPQVPLLLVGTKEDLRDSLGDASDHGIFYADGIRMKETISAVDFMECSAKEMKGISNVFNQAIKAVLRPKCQSKPKSSRCIIL